MAGDEDGVTFGEVVRGIRDIKADIALFKAEMKAEMGKVTDDHEKRLRTVERWMWTALGASLVGAGSGIWSLLGGG